MCILWLALGALAGGTVVALLAMAGLRPGPHVRGGWQPRRPAFRGRPPRGGSGVKRR